MKLTLKINFKNSDFETLSETLENQLVGGFSTSVSLSSGQSDATNSNNCLGANCTSGCGDGQNLNKCNTTYGCGGNYTQACG